MKRVSKKSINIWHLEDSLSIFVILLIATIVFYFLGDYKLVKKTYYLTITLSLLRLIWELSLNPLLYRHMSYEIQDNSLFIKSGAISVSEAIIPFNRIQHIDTEQTFFSRMFNLHSVNIYTAGDTHTISYLSRMEADILKDKMIEYVADLEVHIDE